MSERATSSTAFGIEFPGNVQATQEVKTYLIALYSYADQFAAHRNLTFRKHLMAVMGVGGRRSERRTRRCRPN